MNILIVPEDFRKDQYILKPLVEGMMNDLGKPKGKVRVCQDPLLGGISQALNWDRIAEILQRYSGMVHIFLLIVDRDGNSGRRTALDGIESKSGVVLSSGASGRVLFAENAWQEVEVWALAACEDLPKDWVWAEVRAEPHPKEIYFDVYVRDKGLQDEPGEGRRTLGNLAKQNYRRVHSLCAEDVQALHEKIHSFLRGT